MHETLQPDGCSPKQASGLAPFSQIKPGLENSQNCGTSIPSQVKGKKRGIGDHCAYPVKRERSCSTDDCYSAQYNAESSVKSDIARIMQKGGLVDFEGVEKLIQLMQPDKVEKKIDLTSRSMLAGVVVATEKFECLHRFVELKGLRVFDGWLQDCHKGRVGDGDGSKDGEKSKEEFLFDLLCALDKLPVNVTALENSNIGRSVNNLRSHKNAEIQKKARSLIDIWKTSVNFEFSSVRCYDAESSVQPYISKIMQKDGLVDFEGVEKLIQLMQPDKLERKLSLASRSMVAGVVVATDKLDCLQRFVQLKGLRVFDEWLQDNHKGSVAGGNDSKDGEKSVEEYLFVLLRALDKLPVNLSALQNCNIGRSVNHLRSHKNADIQIKARSLVDIWKKRVQAEMSSVNEEMWSSKFHHQESSHDGGRTVNECNAALKSLITQHSASKTTLLKLPHGESFTKSASSSPGPTKPASLSASSSPTGLTSNVPIIREDRSSSSNQSSLGKEEKSSSMVSAAASKTSNSSSCYRKVSGIPGVIGSRKGNCSGKGLSAHRSSTSDKLSTSSLTSEKDLEGPTTVASNDKLMVIVPNRLRSPVQGVGGASHNGTTSASSLASPPVASDQLDELDNTSKQKSDAHQSNASSGMYIDSVKINDRKDILTATGDGAGSPSLLPDEEKNMSAENSSRSTRAPVKNQSMYGKLHETSFSPMNALIESCAKYSETHSSLSSEDDVGMNLLASVATGEMSRSELVSPANSTENTLAADEVRDEAKSESSPGELSGNAKKHVLSNKPCDSAIADFIRPSLMQAGSEKMNRETDTKEKILDSETHKEVLDKKIPSSNSSLNNLNRERINASVSEEKTGCLSHSDKVKLAVEVASKDSSSNTDCKSNDNEGLAMETDCVHNFTTSVVKSELAERANDEKLQENAPCQRVMSEDGDEVKCSERDDMDTTSQGRDVGRYNSDSMMDKKTALVGHSVASSSSNTDGPKSQSTEVKVEKKESVEHISVSKRGFPACLDHELGKNDDFRGVQSPETNIGEAKWASAASSSDPDAKVKFDLNEGFMVENGEQATLTAIGLTTVPVSNNLQFSLNSFPTLHPASVTVAASSKGLFLPPDDLFRSKGELVWKGSSFTSAFRPAEPRKVVEVSLPLTSMLHDASTSKNGAGILGIDLNIDLNLPEERVIEVMASQDSTLSVGPTTDLLNTHAMLLSGSSGSMLDFDLNMVDDSNETGQCSTSFHNDEGSMVHMKPLGCFPTTDVQRGFDLNDRPGVDDGSAEQFKISQQARVCIPSELPSFGPRPNIPGLGSFSSWFPPGNTYLTVGIPSVIPNRVDQPFPIMPSVAHQRTFVPAGIMPFNPDVYRGSVLSSSPAVSFPSGPFQFSMFPFEPSYPLQSANFPVGATSGADFSTGARAFTPSVNSQLLGPIQRSYIVGHPDSSSNSGLEHSRNWGRQDLDLNAGSGAVESEVKKGFFPLSSSQRSHVLAEEQARMYQASGNSLKRAEPEGGLDSHSFRYKQPSWHPEL